jgi:hypothetical protein
MIAGTNWVLGYSHTSQAKDLYIKEHITHRNRIAEIMEVFFKAGVDTVMGPFTRLGVPEQQVLCDGIHEAEQRTGVKAIIVSTPSFNVTPETPARGFDLGEAARILDEQAELGVQICMPHQCTTDAMADRCTRTLRQMESLCRMIRERGMIPGLSAHMPEAIVYADESGLDVETYISIYNSMGFLMQVEVDWTSSVIQHAKKPVMTIKPMAAGQLRPFQAFNFVWNTIRDIDLVTVGTMSPREAAECIELSLGILERRDPELRLQATRSKKSVTSAK